MSEGGLNNGSPIDVAIIGGGPAGLGAATALKQSGVANVVVLEREPEAGGIPRHCGHFAFGMREFRRVLKGPAYAARLVAAAKKTGVVIHNQTTVTEACSGGALILSSPEGTTEIKPRRVVYATGARETPRSGRLISGARVQGVLNTGALQSMVYLKQRRPFKNPVIIGSELVAFSALMTCQYANIRPVAIIEAAQHVTARWPSSLFPLIKGVKLLTNTRLLEIKGREVVESVVVRSPDGQERNIECDGVILSGQFMPEAALARSGHLKVDPASKGPCVDQWGRCSDPSYFATGNLLRPVESASRCWSEGRQTGHWVARDLAGQLPKPAGSLHIVVSDARLKYAMPQLINPTSTAEGMSNIQMRVTERVSGTLVAQAKHGPIWQRTLNTGPERRIKVPISELVAQTSGPVVEFSIEASSK